MRGVVRNLVFGVPTRFDTNRAIQSHVQMARDLEFPNQEEEGLFYLCRENKSADQLCGYHPTNLRLCFRKWKKQVFS